MRTVRRRQQQHRQAHLKVAIINETMAKYFFGSESPLGRHIGSGRASTPDTEIVGVVRDSKTSTLRTEPRRFVYKPYMQETEIGQMTFYVRARGSASSIGAWVRQVAQRVDTNLPIFDMKTMPPLSTSRCSSSAWWRRCQWRSAGWRRCLPRYE